MSKALEGEHLCLKHQGNHSHYAEHNCTICVLQAEIAKLKEQLKAQGEQEPYGYIEPDGNIISPWNNQPYHIPVYLVIGGRK